MSGQVISRWEVWKRPERTALALIVALGVPRSAANGALHRSTAAAPSLFGQQCNSLSGSATGREVATSSSVTGCRKCARGFAAPLPRFFTDTRERSVTVAPDSYR